MFVRKVLSNFTKPYDFKIGNKVFRIQPYSSELNVYLDPDDNVYAKSPEEPDYDYYNYGKVSTYLHSTSLGIEIWLCIKNDKPISLLKNSNSNTNLLSEKLPSSSKKKGWW